MKYTNISAQMDVLFAKTAALERLVDKHKIDVKSLMGYPHLDRHLRNLNPNEVYYHALDGFFDEMLNKDLALAIKTFRLIVPIPEDRARLMARVHERYWMTIKKWNSPTLVNSRKDSIERLEKCRKYLHEACKGRPSCKADMLRIDIIITPFQQWIETNIHDATTNIFKHDSVDTFVASLYLLSIMQHLYDSWQRGNPERFKDIDALPPTIALGHLLSHFWDKLTNPCKQLLGFPTWYKFQLIFLSIRAIGFASYSWLCPSKENLSPKDKSIYDSKLIVWTPPTQMEYFFYLIAPYSLCSYEFFLEREGSIDRGRKLKRAKRTIPNVERLLNLRIHTVSMFPPEPADLNFDEIIEDLESVRDFDRTKITGVFTKPLVPVRTSTGEVLGPDKLLDDAWHES